MSEKEKVYKEDYASIVERVCEISTYSYNKVRRILSKYTDTLQQALRNGKDIHVPNLVRIGFSTKGYDVIENIEYGHEEQIEDIVYLTDYRKDEVVRVVSIYLNYLQDLAKKGYQVNIQGICYIEPYTVEDTEEVKIKPRLSPVLEKPEIRDYYLHYRKDNIRVVRTLSGKELRFKLQLSEGYPYPSRVVFTGDIKEFTPEYIDI